jgi:hypothetical protein
MVRPLIIGAGLVVASAVFAIAGCSDQYRYPCQDPANQGKPECTPPECVADGTCTDYLVEIHK